MSMFTEKYLIRLEDIKKFAICVGDPNPIHQDDEVAKKMGLQGAIAHGMFVHSYLLRRLDEWMLKEKTDKGVNWEIVSTRCRFHEPALVGKTFESNLEFVEDESNSESAKMNLTFADEAGTRLTHIVAVLKKL